MKLRELGLSIAMLTACAPSQIAEKRPVAPSVEVNQVPDKKPRSLRVQTIRNEIGFLCSLDPEASDTRKLDFVVECEDHQDGMSEPFKARLISEELALGVWLTTAPDAKLICHARTDKVYTDDKLGKLEMTFVSDCRQDLHQVNPLGTGECEGG